MKISIKANNYDSRMDLVKGFANLGYKVQIVEEENGIHSLSKNSYIQVEGADILPVLQTQIEDRSGQIQFSDDEDK
jgi:hypothetical protein